MIELAFNFLPIFHGPNFKIFHAAGDWRNPIGAFSHKRANGTVINDTFTFANRECVVVGYGPGERFVGPAWQDIGQLPASGGSTCVMFDGPYKYWCAQTNDRLNLMMKGKAIHPLAGASGVLNVKAGDTLLLAEGHITIDGINHPYPSSYVAPADAALNVEAVTDSVVIAVRTAPVDP